jgi:hypothetical protein
MELTMKKFLAIYLGTPESHGDWDRLSEPDRKDREQRGMKAWGDWMAKHSNLVLDTGGPLGKTKQVSKQGLKDVRNAMTGYVILQAESHEAAARLFENHPHFAIFPGQAVEIMECLPIPSR